MITFNCYIVINSTITMSSKEPITYGTDGCVQDFTLDEGIMSLVDEICELMDALDSGPEANRETIEASMIASAQASTAIEDNPMTVEQVALAVAGRETGCHPRHVREVLNCHECYRIRPSLDPLSEKNLLRAHGMMTRGLQEDSGNYRDCGVGIWSGDRFIYRAPPAHMVPLMMTDLMEWLRASEHHPLVKACVFHYEFETIHPFSDGNGRTGRLWQSVIMSDWKDCMKLVPYETEVLARRGRYYMVIRSSRQIGNTSPFIRFMLETVRDAARLAQQTISSDEF